METEKLYSPLEFYLHDPAEKESSGDIGDITGEYGLYDERYRIAGVEALEFTDAIELAIRRDRDRMDKVHGLAGYLPEELQSKVHSMFPSIEFHGNDLYCVATVELNEALNAYEMALLKDDWRGNLSDGWGEGFEQREIKVGDGCELYVVPWSSGDEFFIDTEREFMARLGLESPEIIADLRAELIERIDNNIDDFEKGDDFYNTALNDAMENAHYILAEYTDYTSSQLNLLLEFENPLSIIADRVKGTTPSANDLAAHLSFMEDNISQFRAHYATVVAEKSPVIDELHAELAARANQNWEDYRHAPRSTTPDNIFHISAAVISHRDARDFLNEYKDFSAEQLECLLQFADPVDLVADYLDPKSVIGDMPGILSNILENQEEFKKVYALAEAETPISPAQAALDEPDVSEVAGEAKTAALQAIFDETIERNYSDYCDSLRDLSPKEIMDIASDIYNVSEAYYSLTNDGDFDAGELQFLLKFDDPLAIFAEYWARETNVVYLYAVTDVIFGEQSRIENLYKLSAPETGTPDFEELKLSEREELGLGRERRDYLGEDAENLCGSMQASGVPESYTYRAELSDAEYPDRMEVFTAEHDEDALRQALEYCEGGVRLLELHELDGDYEFVRSVDIPKNVELGEKSSVMDEIRQAKKDARERPAAPKNDTPGRKKSDPDL